MYQYAQKMACTFHMQLQNQILGIHVVALPDPLFVPFGLELVPWLNLTAIDLGAPPALNTFIHFSFLQLNATGNQSRWNLSMQDVASRNWNA